MKSLARLLLGVCACSTLVLSTACTSKPAAQPVSSADQQAQAITLRIDGQRLVPDMSRTIPIEASDKPDLRSVLENSGLIVLNEKKDDIASVGDISLDNGLSWAVKLNGVDLSSSLWSKKVDIGDHILVYLKGHDGGSIASLNPVVLNISGGLSKPGLQYYFVNVYHANLTVRDVLEQCGLVQMSDPGRLITAVDGYTGNMNEQWIVKLNNKKLLQSGLDIQLQPSDKLEVVLSLI